MIKSIVKRSKIDKSIILFTTLIISIIIYLSYILIIENANFINQHSSGIIILSWLGIIVTGYIFFSWYIMTDSIFSLYTIFMSFLIIFSYGQCFMWAIGIHKEGEIGTIALYPGFDIPNNNDIFKAQFVILSSILMFHLGALIYCRFKKNYNKISYNKSYDFKIMFYVCLIIAIIVVPLELYNTFKEFQISQQYGYSALYYSEFAQNRSMFIEVSRKMFFPSLLGLLIGSKFRKSTRKYVYIIFFIYLLLKVLSGDRGDWLYKLLILIYLNHKYVKKINLKKLIMYIVISILGLFIIQILVSFRDIGITNITKENIIEIININNSPIVDFLFEMGDSMKPTIVLQKYGSDIWPYSNSYMLAILGMVTNKIIYFFNIKFELLSTWFSQGYLNLNWGAGFSSIAEAILNFGSAWAPITMLIQGFIISSLIYIDNIVDYKKSPLKILFCTATLDTIIPITRNELHIPLKSWFYGVVILCVLISILSKFMKVKLK